MAPEVGAIQRTAWLFIHGETSVAMTVGRDESGLTLSVRGPGTARATYHFKNIAALTMFAEAQEQKLREAGFQLQAYAERRSGRDRRQSARAASRDRRGS